MTTNSLSKESPAYRAYQILHFGFTVLPIIVGLDKFFNWVVNWDQYLAPAIGRLSPVGPHNLLLIIGVIEIVAGIGAWIKPRIFGYVIFAWFWVVIIDLIMIPGYYDIILRDFGLSLGAFALAQLAEVAE